MPDGLSAEQVSERLGARFGSILAVLGLFESLGPIIARGHIPIEMYAESYRGVTVICWNKMRPWIEDQRRQGWPNLFEWLQWLAERMEERISLSSEVPAFQQYSAWRSGGDYDRMSRKR